MSKVEAGKVSKIAGYSSLATMAAGPGFFDFPIGGGGLLSSASILANSPTYIHGRGLNTLNPFGGYHTYTPEFGHIESNGVPDVTWHAAYHPYTFTQGFDLVMGEATLALLATAGVSKLLSMAGRRMSRGRASK